VIIGHSQTRNAVGFTGYYHVIRSLYRLKQNPLTNFLFWLFHTRLEANPDLAANLVPVDFVVRAMWEVAQTKPNDAFVFHIVHDSPVPLAELFEIAFKTLGLSKIQLAGQRALQQKPFTVWEKLIRRRFLQAAQFQAPYLRESPLFDAANFRRVVPRDVLPCPKLDWKFLYEVNLKYLGFLKRQSSEKAGLSYSTDV
jgi:hypothetical protein